MALLDGVQLLAGKPSSVRQIVKNLIEIFHSWLLQFSTSGYVNAFGVYQGTQSQFDDTSKRHLNFLKIITPEST